MKRSASVWPVLLLFILLSCKKEKITVPDNRAPYYDQIPTVLIENYVNRIFIDLIGREPLDDEMELEVSRLREQHLSFGSRKSLINKLQSDTSYREGDLSYKQAYYHRFYEMCKVRLLEGASDAIFYEEIGNINFSILADSLEGDSLNMEVSKAERSRLEKVLACKNGYMTDSISVNEVLARMLDNQIYDKINMNTFNFINASFDDLFFRFPTNWEFQNSYDMIEFNTSAHVLGVSGQNKGDYIQILTRSREFYQGMITWAYVTLLARYPSSNEVAAEMKDFYSTGNFQDVQLHIMIKDEYANF